MCGIHSPNLKALLSFLLKPNHVSIWPPNPLNPLPLMWQLSVLLLMRATSHCALPEHTHGQQRWFFFPLDQLLCKAHQGSEYKICIQVLRKKGKKAHWICQAQLNLLYYLETTLAPAALETIWKNHSRDGAKWKGRLKQGFIKRKKNSF